MSGAAELYQRSWGSGAPVIALHPLGLESSGFAALGRVLARRGLQTIAVDLPGFGRSPAPARALTPEVLAEPVIALARRLPEPPVVLGLSLGGRVALEMALRAPEAVRGVIAIAPALPQRHFRALLAPVRLLDPRLADWLPLERAWPLLRWLAQTVEATPYLRDDAIAQAGARLVYYFACPATRASFLSAAREMVLEPAYGPRGFWGRLPELSVPALFVWGQRDRLISTSYAHHVALACPQVPQLLLPCVAHWVNGPHHRCLAEAVAEAVQELAARPGGGRRRAARL
ncbi:MAG TPA: alpha/beta fold hydrolase, partial [Candidatus Dormibacteraeota bacterium]|nr:alpha/beta fold hydrolase [Candidatus Dormibacteraeota bacterium]